MRRKDDACPHPTLSSLKPTKVKKNSIDSVYPMKVKVFPLAVPKDDESYLNRWKDPVFL
jgi:hypothetical protein